LLARPRGGWWRTAERMDYRRAGGLIEASNGAVVFHPDSSSGLSDMGAIHLSAPRISGETGGKRGSASGGVQMRAERGDTARSQRADYEGDVVRTHGKTEARGPGYRVEGDSLTARTDGTEIELMPNVRGQLQVGGQR
jgi:lipopolysaccharide export system protein LptC